MSDLISRQAAIDAICKACANGEDYLRCRDRDIKSRWCDNITALRDLPSAQPDPLTDKEQRIFLAAMGREEKVCKQVDAECRERADAFDNPSRFRVEAGGSAVGIALVTDRETGVQYLMNIHTGTCTVLVDKEGRPWLANGWRDYQ